MADPHASVERFETVRDWLLGLQDRICAAIEALDLETLSTRPVSTLSGGEKARALLARVLAGEPRWLLADEPLAAFDLRIEHSRHILSFGSLPRQRNGQTRRRRVER